MLPYFPLAAGLLSGPLPTELASPAGSRLAHSLAQLAAADWDVLGRIDAMAAQLGRPIAELALAYLASQPAVVSVVVGATTPEQVRSNARAVASPCPRHSSQSPTAVRTWPRLHTIRKPEGTSRFSGRGAP